MQAGFSRVISHAASCLGGEVYVKRCYGRGDIGAYAVFPSSLHAFGRWSASANSPNASGSHIACVCMECVSSSPSRWYYDRHEVAVALFVLPAFCLRSFLDFEGKYCESRLCVL